MRKIAVSLLLTGLFTMTGYSLVKQSITLQATPNNKENSINLEWTNLDEHIYKVYQKKPGSNEFQSISASDLSKGNQVKVLNLYPVNNDPDYPYNTLQKITFDTWDGEHMTVPKSASLKMWMEQPNDEDSKGYGRGQIEVTPVPLNDFNNNPNAYLTKKDNKYNYDVIVIGTWDGNADIDTNSMGIESIKDFIKSGGGVLIGHDTTLKPYLSTLLSYLDMVRADDMFGSNIENQYFYSSIQIVKKGLLTSHPWNIGEIGDELIIPLSHTWQMSKAEKWLEFTPEGYPVLGQLIEDDRGTNNHYLSTKGNVAMIQTGHSRGEATSDEQKILANTLFYLNQLSTENFLNDKSGQDLEAPVMKGGNYTIDNGIVTFKVNPAEDKGSLYEYYVEGYPKVGGITKTSNIVKTEIKSGIKGYSYVIDDKKDTIPDDIVEMNSLKDIKVPAKSNLTLHIKAIDYGGNSSEVLRISINDITKPSVSHTITPNIFTNGEVEIQINAVDNGTGINRIILPNGNEVKGNSASFRVSENGLYSFMVEDKVLNKTFYIVEVKNIDKERPTVNITNKQDWTNENVEVTVTADK